MKFFKTNILLFLCTSFCSAQTPTDLAFNQLVSTLGRLSLGTSLADFSSQKPNLPPPDDGMMFRYEIVETVEKDGLKSVTYYFDGDGDKPLYESIIEFSSAEIRDAVAEKLFGKPNHPTEPNRWILGVQDGVVSIGWSFGQKFVIAANLPGSEWTGDAQFEIPKGFEMHKNLPPLNEWPAEERIRFFQDFELQIEAATSNFEKIKGVATEGGFVSKQPLGMAESSIIVVNASGKLELHNRLTSDMDIEKAVDWQASLSKLFEETTPTRYRLKRGNFKTLLGRTAGIWNVSDKNGKQTGVQVGLVSAGGPLFSVFLVVLRD